MSGGHKTSSVTERRIRFRKGDREVAFSFCKGRYSLEIHCMVFEVRVPNFGPALAFVQAEKWLGAH